MPIFCRFAPSPSGYLHLGNIRAALLNRLAAGSAGALLLRIEDTDAIRGEEVYIDAIIEDLKWLGISWQAGDNGLPWRQSQMAAAHNQSCQLLLDKGAAYPCFCSPQQLKAEREAQRRAGKPPRYARHCANLSPAEVQKRRSDGAPAAIRFSMPPDKITVTDVARGIIQFNGGDIGDFIIRRADGSFSFFFANAIDDANSGITLVLRGEDHLSNTPRQIAILQALALSPPQYGHLSLMSADGGLLSKRSGALSARYLRQIGFLPAAIINYLARVGCAIGDESLMTIAQLMRAFSLSMLSHSPATFDMAQLQYWQKRALSSLSTDEYCQWLSKILSSHAPADKAAFCDATRDNITLYKDAEEWLNILYHPLTAITPPAQAAAAQAGEDFYQAAAAAISDNMEWTPFCDRVSATTGAKGKNLFMPLRAALTGRADGPTMPAIFKIIGYDNAVLRLKQAGDSRFK